MDVNTTYIPPGTEAFTPRERETIRLIADGHSNKIIAAKLDISEHTAKFHVTNVMRKLDADNRAAAAVAAVRLGLA
jgi:two-component system, NarL family, nitrate/nitrite response regulator NarL